MTTTLTKDRFRVYRRVNDAGRWRPVFAGTALACERWAVAQGDETDGPAFLCLRDGLDPTTFIREGLRRVHRRRREEDRQPRPAAPRPSESWTLWLRANKGPWFSLGRFDRAGKALDASHRLEGLLADGDAAEWFVQDEGER